MNNIQQIIKQSEEAVGRFVGDLNLLTLAAFNCVLSQVTDLSDYSQEQVDQFNEYLDKFFNTDIPTAYIVGFEYFLGNKIIVNQNTLIPRFETEELVINLEQRLRRKYPVGSTLDIADICCGSGVIGVSLYLRLKADYKLSLTFVDISSEAMEVTKLNCAQYDIEANYLLGDMAKPLVENSSKFDVIVSNPPYIDIAEQVQQTVLDYEPKLALYAEDKGLALYKTLINDIIIVGKDQFCLMLEIGETQAVELDLYLETVHKLNFEIIKDMNRSDRNLYLEV